VTGFLSNGTAAGCSVTVKQLAEITAGLWYNFYKGEWGRLAGGLHYEYVHRDTFAGTTPASSRNRSRPGNRNSASKPYPKPG
jgi:hypothetical protein